MFCVQVLIISSNWLVRSNPVDHTHTTNHDKCALYTSHDFCVKVTELLNITEKITKEFEK